MSTHPSAESEVAALEFSAPSAWGLALVLAAWSLPFSRPLLGPVLQALGLVVVWGFIGWRGRASWPATRSQLSAKLSVFELFLVIGMLACLLFALPAVSGWIEARLPGRWVLTWAAAAIWSLGVVYALIGFRSARRRWAEARNTG
jgi:small-conductance mechanosensitive channel